MTFLIFYFVSLLHLSTEVTAIKVPLSSTITLLYVHSSTQQFLSHFAIHCSYFLYSALFEISTHADFTNNEFPQSEDIVVARRQRNTQHV